VEKPEKIRFSPVLVVAVDLGLPNAVLSLLHARDDQVEATALGSDGDNS